jgi:hypothetical protein
MRAIELAAWQEGHRLVERGVVAGKHVLDPLLILRRSAGDGPGEPLRQVGLLLLAEQGDHQRNQGEDQQEVGIFEQGRPTSFLALRFRTRSMPRSRREGRGRGFKVDRPWPRGRHIDGRQDRVDPVELVLVAVIEVVGVRLWLRFRGRGVERLARYDQDRGTLGTAGFLAGELDPGP